MRTKINILAVVSYSVLPLLLLLLLLIASCCNNHGVVQHVNGWVIIRRHCHDPFATATRNIDSNKIKNPPPTLSSAIPVSTSSSSASSFPLTLLSAAAIDEEENGEEQEVLEYLDDDDDDDDDKEELYEDPQAVLAQQQQWMDELQHLARITSLDPTAIQQSQTIFDAMFTAYVTTDDAGFFPSVDVYNLLLEIQAYSKDDKKDDTAKNNGALEVERIVARMEDPTNDFVARPNYATYLCLIDAWTQRNEPDKVKAIIETKIMMSQRNTNDENNENENSTDPAATTPTGTELETIAYNKLIKAYGVAGDYNAADATFQRLLSDGKADHNSWVQLLKAKLSSCNSNNSNGDNNDDTADDDQKKKKKKNTKSNNNNKLVIEKFMEEMKENGQGIVPGTEIYNILIRYSRSSPSSTTNSFVEAESILFRMIDMYRNGNDDSTYMSIKPNVDTFRAVLNTYRNNRKLVSPATVAAKVEQLLQIRDGILLDKGTTQERQNNRDILQDVTDERTYKVALDLISRSTDAKKAIRCQRILHKRQQVFVTSPSSAVAPSSTAPLLPPRDLQYFVLKACAYTNNGTPEEKFDTFQIAVSTLQDLRGGRSSSSLQEEQQRRQGHVSDSSVLGMFLRSCSKLMTPGNPKRDVIVQQIFGEACDEGLVNDFVLNEFRAASSEKLQLEILDSSLLDVDGGGGSDNIPPAWTRNVIDHR